VSANFYLTVKAAGSGKPAASAIANMSNDAPVPACRVLVRSKHALELFTLSNPEEENTTPPKVTLLDASKSCTSNVPACLAPDGSFALVHVASLGLVQCQLSESTDASSMVREQFFSEPTAQVQMMDISPLGNYLLTWERYHAERCTKNLRVWCTRTGRLLASFPQKSLARESWPYLQWTQDELYAFLVVNGTQVRTYAAKDIIAFTADASTNGDTKTIGSEPRFCDKLQVPCTTLSVQQHPAAIGAPSPSQSTKKYYFTTFVGKTKDKPAVASVYSYIPPAQGKSDTAPPEASEKSFTRIATKSLFQAEECVTRWSPLVHTTPACLMTLSVAIDATGQSYYGNSQLWLWTASSDSEMMAVPLPQEGPVLSCQWVPDPSKPPSFLVIAGKIPPMASQHHGMTGAVTFLYGNNVHRNTVIFSPHGRFVCLAGFGNMPGGMSFWDVNKKKLIPHSVGNANGTLKSDTPVTLHSWSPDSRYFLTATTAPRMNVENGIRLHKYTGELVADDILPWKNSEYQPNFLYEACFVPALPTVYPDRPQSPIPERNETEMAAAKTAPVAASKPAAYVPPSARNSMGTGTSLAERLRREKEGTLQGATKVTKAAPVNAAARVIPGLTIAPATKSKSQIKREKLKQKKDQQPSDTTDVAPEAHSVEPPTSQSAPLDPEKRARKLKKIIKQIEELKLQSEPLNEDQRAKVASEESIRKELEELGGS
jgi:translation initiation factor 2A